MGRMGMMGLMGVMKCDGVTRNEGLGTFLRAGPVGTFRLDLDGGGRRSAEPRSRRGNGVSDAGGEVADGLGEFGGG